MPWWIPAVAFVVAFLARNSQMIPLFPVFPLQASGFNMALARSMVAVTAFRIGAVHSSGHDRNFLYEPVNWHSIPESNFLFLHRRHGGTLVWDIGGNE